MAKYKILKRTVTVFGIVLTSGFVQAILASRVPNVSPTAAVSPAVVAPTRQTHDGNARVEGDIPTSQLPVPRPEVTSEQVQEVQSGARRGLPAHGSRALKVWKPLKAEMPSRRPTDAPAGGLESRLVFGRSVRGMELVAYVLGSGADTTMVLAGMHGNEAGTTGVVEALRRHLTAHPRLLDGVSVILVSRINPDGLAKGSRTNANNVDLNRNFDVGWKPVAVKARYHPGPRPLSEPESRALAELVDRFCPAKVINLHQPLHMMNYTGENGRRLAVVMRRHNGYRISDDIGYATPGSFGNFCGARKIGIVTLELPPESSAQAWSTNREALLAAIRLREGER